MTRKVLFAAEEDSRGCLLMPEIFTCCLRRDDGVEGVWRVGRRAEKKEREAKPQALRIGPCP
jgi:hypothetical protein